MTLKTIADADVLGKRVLVRVDYNVPLREEHGRWQVSDATRISASIPTIAWLVEHGAKVILCSHLGRPKGREMQYSLGVVAPVLEALLNGDPAAEMPEGAHLRSQLEAALSSDVAAKALPIGIERLAEHGVEALRVVALDETTGPAVAEAIAKAGPGDILLLENLRFDAREEHNDPAFAAELAALADLYVSDAFGTVHRAHASTEGVARLLPAYSGFLVEKEVRALSAVIRDPKRPLVVIMGGAKISGKIEVLDKLIPLADMVLIGGAMANTFLGAQGFGTGKSLVETGMFETAKRLVSLADEKGTVLLFPVDYVVTDNLESPRRIEVKLAHDIGSDDLIVDIGPKSIESYGEALNTAATVFWNGPMGVFERPEFANGTLSMALALAQIHDLAMTVVGGGESVDAVNRAGVADRIRHVSTGGGASLEFVSGADLPGIKVLEAS